MQIKKVNCVDFVYNLRMLMLWHLLLCLTQPFLSYAAEDEPFLSSWILDNNTLSFAMSRHFAVYDETRDTIFGVGGTDCPNCAYAYDLTNHNVSSFTIDATSHSATFFNGDVCNAALIGDIMFALDHSGNIWNYNVGTREISIKLCHTIHIQYKYISYPVDISRY